MKIRILNGKLIDPGSSHEGEFDLLIENGKIAAIERQGAIPKQEGETIDAKGLAIFPGFVDLHTHLREPGEEYKETVQTGCNAAVAGGFTTICCMANTHPVNDHGAITEYILGKAREANGVHVYPIGAVSKGLQGEELAEIAEMREVGAVAISDDGRPLMNGNLTRRAMEYARNFDLPMISHCEDKNLSSEGVMHEGYWSTRLGLPAIPSASEEIMVARDILLAELTGAHLHIAHVSTKGSVDLIRRAKERGIRISAEVTPHHLILTEEALQDYDTNAKVNPPLRSEKDRQALWQGLKEGVIDCIATDHAPHDINSKNVDICQAAFGMIGLETAFSLSLRLVESGTLSLSELIEKMTIQPAKLLGLPAGTLSMGSPADLTLVDGSRTFRYYASLGGSKSHNSPFDQCEFKGKVVMTLIAGQVVYTEKKDDKKD
ncbi:MAG: dihydroorotase [Deltaproteobacteria bacterium]|nr:dihydroorotase [Deltaproteobacteria bacterium]